MLERLLRSAYSDFLQYKRDHRLDCTHPRFTPARLNRLTRASFATLSCKAAASKCISFWLIYKFQEWSQRPEASERDKQVAFCFWNYGEFLRLMDQSPLIFAPDVAEYFFKCGMEHLRLYSALRLRSSRTFGAASTMRFLFMLLPKHHYLQHLLFDVRTSHLNPKYYTLLCGESWIGLTGRIARTAHRSSLSKRVLERYLVKLGLHCEALTASG